MASLEMHQRARFAGASGVITRARAYDLGRPPPGHHDPGDLCQSS